MNSSGSSNFQLGSNFVVNTRLIGPQTTNNSIQSLTGSQAIAQNQQNTNSPDSSGTQLANNFEQNADIL
jgi:hypothetical protein